MFEEGALMVRRRSCAVSNHERAYSPSFETRPKKAAPQDEAVRSPGEMERHV
jgi:hypothetical protein